MEELLIKLAFFKGARNKAFKIKKLLIELNACQEARKWAGDKTVEQVINECHRGDWLLWLAKEVEVDERLRVLTAAHCANTVRHLMTDERSRNAVDVAIAYGEGRATEDDLGAARYAAWEAAEDAAKYAVDIAIRLAARAAEDALGDWGAAKFAADAIYYDNNYSNKAKKQNQKQTADICRQYLGQQLIDKCNELNKKR